MSNLIPEIQSKRVVNELIHNDILVEKSSNGDDFIRFNSLKNTYMDQFVGRLKRAGYLGHWIVTEKLHGANFQFRVYRDGRIKTGSREQYVNDNFFKAGSIIKPTKVKLLEKASLIFDKYPEAVSTIIYGELVGPRIAKKHVVHYGNDYGYYAFEMRLIDAEDNQIILDYDDFTDCCQMLDVPTVPLIFKTLSLQEALDTNDCFQSLLTPDGYEKENLTEGITISPAKALFSGETRLYAKKKHHRASPKTPKEKKILSSKLTDKATEFQNVILTFVTDDRIDSVVSKLGEVTSKDYNKVLGLYMVDLFEAVNDCLNDQEGTQKRFRDHIKEKSDDQWKLIDQGIRKTVSIKVMNYLST